MTLRNKVALVTGAASGIGRAIAFSYAEAGAKVVVSDADEAGAQTADEIHRRGGIASFFRADVSRPEDNEALVAEAVARYGALHIAANNAGIGGPVAPLADYPVDGWNRVLAVNLSGVFYGMRAQIPAMLKAGGSIVNVGSILGQVGFRGSPAYVAAKHGLMGLTRSAALDYATQNIRINCVGPAFIRTPMLGALDAATLKALEGAHPMGRMGEAGEVAELVLWLSSDKASFVTGSYYAVDGGYLAQ